MKKLIARTLASIPSSCPFSRDVRIASLIIHIPPLCKLNPFYGLLMQGKMWAMEYLAQ